MPLPNWLISTSVLKISFFENILMKLSSSSNLLEKFIFSILSISLIEFSIWISLSVFSSFLILFLSGEIANNKFLIISFAFALCNLLKMYPFEYCGSLFGNKKIGFINKFVKYGFYSFYPVHILVIYLINE